MVCPSREGYRSGTAGESLELVQPGRGFDAGRPMGGAGSMDLRRRAGSGRSVSVELLGVSVKQLT